MFLKWGEMQLSSAQLVGASDETLIEATRAGNNNAYAELWSRHSPAALIAARSVTRLEDPDDLVSEAFTRILQALHEGRGPSTAFRPYLLVSVRNIAVSRSRARRETNLEEAEEIADPLLTEATMVASFEQSAVATAYQTLPKRWQQVLWYSEVENMPTENISVILGVSPKNVPTLAFRAREGLRQAWIQAHISSTAPSSEHRWVLGQLGRYTRGAVTESRRARIDNHLAECRDCAKKASEARTVGSTLALALLGLVLGGGATAYAAWTGVGVAAASAATLTGTLVSESARVAVAASSGAGSTAASGSMAQLGFFARIGQWSAASPGIAISTGVLVVIGAVGAAALAANLISGGGASSNLVAEPASSIAAPNTTQPSSSAPVPSATTTPNATAIPAVVVLPTAGVPATTVAPPPTTMPPTPSTSPTASPSATTTPSVGATLSASASPSLTTPEPPVLIANTATVDTANGALSPVFTGEAISGSSVTVQIDGQNVDSTQATAKHTWSSVPRIQLTAGMHTATIAFQSPTGANAVQTMDFALVSPSAVIGFAPGTFSPQIEVSGIAGTTYQLLVDGQTMTTMTLGDDGNAVTHSLPPIAWDTLSAAAVTLQAVSADRVGPEVALALPAVVPEISTVDTGGGAFYPVVSGRAPAGATVNVTDGADRVSVVADSSGEWKTGQLENVTTGAPTFVSASIGDGVAAASTTFTVKDYYLVVTPSVGAGTEPFPRMFIDLIVGVTYTVTAAPYGTCQTAFSTTVVATSNRTQVIFPACQMGNYDGIFAQAISEDRSGPLATALQNPPSE